MRLDLLLVEDNGHKRDRIVSFLEELFPDWDVVQANSFTEGSRAVLEKFFHVILMDMSLPTYERKGNESGGRFRTFGGREIARKALRRDDKVRILFVTQYEAFSDQGASKSFDSIDSELRVECGDRYAGMVHFDSSKTAWKEQISSLLIEVSNETLDS